MFVFFFDSLFYLLFSFLFDDVLNYIIFHKKNKKSSYKYSSQKKNKNLI
jgi:hypothetical protein